MINLGFKFTQNIAMGMNDLYQYKSEYNKTSKFVELKSAAGSTSILMNIGT